MLTPWKESYDQPRQHIKKQRHYFFNKGPSSQGYGFSSAHVWMWELDYKESWVPKNWCFWTVVLEKTLESPLDCKVIQPVHPKGNQSWTFIERSYVEAETPILWPPDAKSWLIWKDPDAGKDWGQEEKGMTEEEMFGWHSQHNWHEFEWIPGVDNGQGGLACCSSLVRKELDTTEWLNWTDIVQENSIRIILCLYNISSEQGQKICACIKVSFSMAPLILILNLKCPFEMPLETGKNNKSKTLKYTKFI